MQGHSCFVNSFKSVFLTDWLRWMKPRILFLCSVIFRDINMTSEISCCPSLVTLGTFYEAFAVYCCVFVGYFTA